MSLLSYLWYPAILCSLLVTAAVCHVVRILFVLPLFDPMRKLPGPNSNGLMESHMYIAMNANNTPRSCDQLVKTYGKTMRLNGFGSWDSRFYTLDHRALTYILNNANKYQKPWQSRRVIGGLIGYGMLATEGTAHRLQKKVITPAFSSANLRDFLPIFFDKAKELLLQWDNNMENTTHADQKSSSAEIDVYHWMARAAFDMIGLAGFDYAFNAIQNEDNPVYIAYKRMFGMTLDQQRGMIPTILGVYCPWFYKIFPDEATRAVTESHKVIYAKCQELIETKRAAVLKEMEYGNKDEPAKDLFSRLMKSNLSTSLPENQRLPDRDLMDNINTTLFAGSDTTSLALAWTLHLLALHPDIQSSLRAELTSAEHSAADPSDPVVFASIDELPLLNNVIRESLRLIPPVHSSLRVAMEDDVIPTAEPVRMRDGSMNSEGVFIKKGTYVHVALEGINMLRDVWGEDAPEFHPARWNDLPEAVKQNPGIYGNMMTFSHGPRACIGVRFSVMILKTFIYFLVTSCRFEPIMTITKENRVMVRPYPKGEWNKTSRLPLRVSRIEK